MQSENQDVGFSFTDCRSKSDTKTRWDKYSRIKRHLRGTSGQQVFPLGQDGETVDDIQRPTANTLTARYEGAQAVGSYIIEDKLDAQGINQLNNSTHSNNGVYLDDGISPALIRRLTPLECERFQGFPDRYTEGVSDSQRYKCLGNAVTTTVIQAITRSIISKGNI